MARIQQLLDQVYYLIDTYQVEEAGRLLDYVLEDDPHNIEAWEVYVQISTSQADLESLAERVRWNRDLTPAEKREILTYQEYMAQHLDEERLEEYGVEPESSSSSSRSALTILAAIFALLVGLWVAVPDIRSMTPFYFLLLFVIGLGYWFWKADQPGRYDMARSFSYGVSGMQLAEAEKPELFYSGPIIKVGPLPEDDED